MTDEIKKVDKGGRRPGKPRSAKERHLVAAGQIMHRLKKAADGEIEMTSSQVRAAEVYLSKTMPSLQAVEQTNLNEQDTKSLDQLKSELIAIVQANPELLLELNAAVTTVQAVKADDKLTVNSSSQSMH